MNRKLDKNHSLAYFLKSAREDMDLTQAEVMKITGINSKTLSGYENGISEPDFATLATLAKLYHMSLDEIVETQTNSNNSYGITKNEQNMLLLFRQLSEDKQNEFIVQLKAIIEYVKCKEKAK